MKDKKQPERMCVACRKMKPKDTLRRVVCFDDVVEIDLPGKKPGRGAYICLDEQCIKRAEKARALERAFKKNIDREIYLLLQKELTVKNE